MAIYREQPCRFYVALGTCSKGRNAQHKGYCQHCGKYQPRAKVRRLNSKKQKLDKIRKGEYLLPKGGILPFRATGEVFCFK